MNRRLSRLFHRGLPWVVLAHAALCITFWLTSDLLASLNGSQGMAVRLLLIVSGGVAAWSLGRLLRIVRPGWAAGFFSWLYMVVSVLYLVIFYGSFAYLFTESPVQLARLEQMLWYFRIILDPLGLIGLAVALGLGMRKLRTARASKPAPLFPVLLWLGAFICLWLIPVFFPPRSVYRGTMPSKPRLIAHRGAAMLAPENTIPAAKVAAGLGAYGLETDLHFSQDGQLFLMHDDTLKRTTNVATVFPGRENERAESFNLAEVRRLDAGSWFIAQDPFGAVGRGMLPEDQLVGYQGTPVPLLSDELDIVRQNRLIFIFDLKQPPSGHPYNQSYFDMALRQIHESGIDSQVWFLVNQQQLQAVKAQAPAMKLAYGADFQELPVPDNLEDAGYQIVNVEYGIPGKWVRAYRETGLWVNVYVVDEPWQFSRLWLLGADSVTTNNLPGMIGLQHPLLAMPYPTYLLGWSLAGLLGMAIILTLTSPRWAASLRANRARVDKE